MTTVTTHEHPAGLTWTEGDAMARSWHALGAGDRFWLVDPVDASGVVDRALTLGAPAGVLQLLDRHPRDCAAIAERLGVPHHRLPTTLPDAPFELFRVVDKPKWRETGLWWAEHSALVIPEAVGTGPAFVVGSCAVGVHPLLRAFGVGQLRRWQPEVLLMGHGAPVSGPGTTATLHEAIGRSRSDLPGLLRKLPKLVRGG